MIRVAVVYAMIGMCVAALSAVGWRRMGKAVPIVPVLCVLLLWPMPLVSAVLIEVSPGWRRFLARFMRRTNNHDDADELEERFPDDDAS